MLRNLDCLLLLSEGSVSAGLSEAAHYGNNYVLKYLLAEGGVSMLRIIHIVTCCH
jgi:hypothetical protein